MNLSQLSIKRPIFVTCIILLMLVTGYMSLKRLGVDLFPDVTFPVVVVNIPYPGAGPAEIETLVSKVLEDELSSLPGLKSLRSINQEGTSTIVAEFKLEVDIKYAEQQVRDKVGAAKSKLPREVKEAVILRVDPSNQPILTVTFTAPLKPSELFDLADQNLKARLQQVPNVGRVEIIGGRKREIRVELDRQKLNAHKISVTQVAERLNASGQNIPAGKVTTGAKDTVFRTLGEFRSIQEIEQKVVSFFGNEVPIPLSQLGRVNDTLEEEKSRAYMNGAPSLFLVVYKQSGTNTIEVVDQVRAQVRQIEQGLFARIYTDEPQNPSGGALIGAHFLHPPQLTVVTDLSRYIRANVADVKESIVIGIILTIIVVYFFLGNLRSTLITTLALPNCLLGAFLFMGIADFTINMMTLLALSLSVGLLVDDAIVVRENIFRHYEMGKSPAQAALEGTKEVTLAVIATTLTVMAVFGPIAFIQGIVGQFFKEFGLTICFAMAISLFDALTIAPMLSAYLFSGLHSPAKKRSILRRFLTLPVRLFDRFQDLLERGYVLLLRATLRVSWLVLLIGLGIFVFSLFILTKVPATFLPPQDDGEFAIELDLPPGTSLQGMADFALKVDQIVRANREVKNSVLTVGNIQGEVNVASFYVELIPHRQRNLNTSQVKQKVRDQLKEFSHANPKVKDFDAVGGGERPFTLFLMGDDQGELERFSKQVLEKIKNHPSLKDVDLNFRPGKPEIQVQIDDRKAQSLGVSTVLVGAELRAQMEGVTPALFREKGLEYDIRVRLQEGDRDLRSGFLKTYIPNINQTLIQLKEVASLAEKTGPSKIFRLNRGRYVEVSADLNPTGPGMGQALQDLNKLFAGELKPPAGIKPLFRGQAENFQELIGNMLLAAFLGGLFIYLVLASLYESFITPFTIMLVLPLAACGAFFALYLTGQYLDIFSMIGCILLLGVATKNSIILVDYINQQIEAGMSRKEAILLAGKTRLRPILMTSFALIAGMVPVAIGLNEASRQRVSMGISVIGGLISSTLLTLIVIPAAFGYIDRFRLFVLRLFRRGQPAVSD